MSQTITAIFENGLLRPTQPLELPEASRVRVTVEVLEENPGQKAANLAALEDLWRSSKAHSGKLTRDQLHERR